MEKPQKNLAMLFAQLGLPNDPDAIARFIATHRPLAADLALSAAPFWTASQCAFLQQGLADDADWSAIVDALSLRLR